MHELAVTQNILSIALEKANGAQASRITQIDLVIGELSGFAPDCIQFYFDLISKDTIAERADLHFQLRAAQLRCRHCSAVFQPKNSEWRCLECQSESVEIIGGRDSYIESIQVE
jgi:hydrogenase nickel incorporation protein HypA/HybF